jgi:acyl-[acyl-carrier-protein]-phospholipid O-acyltransferase/long-chain-fatty-acid--[acyl-carrier-protein] ligase
MLYIEDILKKVTPVMKIKALVKTWCVPADLLTGEKKGIRDTTATVIFSSGSTAEPKGIILSHHNIVSDIESLTKALHFGKEDALCAALPFFHSFGYTATIWFPLITGFKACYHPNPLEGEIIAKVVRENRATMLLATPTFLKAYHRKATREDFGSLKLIIVGAEKLKQDLAESFEKKFGIRPLEGYGATELSPVVSLNMPDVTCGNRTYPRCKEGSVGMPLYGITARVVDPDTFEDLRYGEPGLLLIKGPNVMKGYLGKSELTNEAVKDGWYNTGDIAVVDEYGYITLTDRLSRFSKIGGEMVPRGAVEDLLQNAVEAEEQAVAVTAIPDEKRGEKLVVLYTSCGNRHGIHI